MKKSVKKMEDRSVRNGHEETMEMEDMVRWKKWTKK